MGVGDHGPIHARQQPVQPRQLAASRQFVDRHGSMLADAIREDLVGY
jgi:hypothetical protein